MPQSRQDAIAMLREDHVKVRRLLEKIENTSERAARTRKDLLAELGSEIRAHAKLEEEVFYPAFKEAVDKDKEELYHEAVEEHHVVEMLLPELEELEVTSEEWTAKATVLKELIEHHIEDEETEMFKEARKAMDHAELVELADQMAQRRTELMAVLA